MENAGGAGGEESESGQSKDPGKGLVFAELLAVRMLKCAEIRPRTAPFPNLSCLRSPGPDP